MEVVGTGDDLLFAVLHALDLGAPKTGGLERGLHRFRAGVHGQDHVLARELRQALIEIAQVLAVERAAGQGALVQLCLGGRHDLRMTMAEVVGGVGGQHIEVLTAFRIGDHGAFGLHDDDGLGRVVVGAVLVGFFDDLF